MTYISPTLCTHVFLVVIQKTPLWLACSKGHLAAAEVLIEKEARVYAHEKNGGTGTQMLNCLDVAVKEGHKYVCSSLYLCLNLLTHKYIIYTWFALPLMWSSLL